ncbi:hypothetical protein Q5P01_009207 [Channa striata]|uniref:Uncharacterized protein n=1 Tax=Channa striata TaxID=64152 RepID=A0AA88N5G0_CHASR|nr:hypothetical protein Q5P01_009207 [Channa striata]
MSPVKTVHGPRTEPPAAQAERPRPEKRGKKRARGGKPKFLLKVKLPKFSCSSFPTEKEKSPPRWMFTGNTNTGGETGAGSDCRSVEVDVFCFSQKPSSKATNQQEKGKHSVLRTISKMLEENQLIRQRLAALSQTS